MRAAVLALILTGCANGVAPLSVDEEFLKKCEELPRLEGKSGADIVKWAEKAGPLAVECRRVHNGLVTIIRAQQ